MNEKEFELNKKLEIAKLIIDGLKVCKEIAAYPNIGAVIQDRVDHLERGELWLTEDAINLLPLENQLFYIQMRIRAIQANRFDDGKSGRTVSINLKSRAQGSTFVNEMIEVLTNSGAEVKLL